MPGTLQIVATQRIQRSRKKNDWQHTKATAKRIANLNVNRKIASAPQRCQNPFTIANHLVVPNHNNGHEPRPTRFLLLTNYTLHRDVFCRVLKLDRNDAHTFRFYFLCNAHRFCIPFCLVKNPNIYNTNENNKIVGNSALKRSDWQ